MHRPISAALVILTLSTAGATQGVPKTTEANVPSAQAEPGSAKQGSVGGKIEEAAPAAAGKVVEKGLEAVGDRLKAGELIRHGFTAGVALAVHMPIFHQTRSLQRDPSISALPYVAWLPFRYAIRGDITRAYCSTLWGGNKDAQAVANEMAVAEARTVTEKEWDAKYSKMPGMPKDWATFNAHIANDDDAVEEATGWDPRLRGRCWPAYLPGLYLGVPSDFNANSQVLRRTDDVKGRDFSPFLSTGIAFAPLAAFSLLFGVTLSTVPDDAEKNHVLASYAVAVGGNFDLAGLFME